MSSHRLIAAALSLVFLSPELLAAPRKKTNQESYTAEDAQGSEGPNLFPAWSPDPFDWTLGPIIGARARKTEYGGIKYASLLSEFGLGARVQGIPLLPENPGITVEPYASYTWGNRTQKAKGAGIDETDSSGFQRHWYGILGRLYYGAFRYSLDLGRGGIAFDDKNYQDLTANRFVNDFGLMILPYLSAHYTLTSYQLREGGHSTPAINEFDQWLHARVAFPFLQSRFDIGPGFTSTEYAALNLTTGNYGKVADVENSYIKALASMHLFWKLGLSAYGKYILSADDATGLNDTIDQLPNENLAQNRSLAYLPKDSLEASLFFGLKNLIGGFGFGYQIYYLELKQDEDRKQISRDSGLVLSYDAGF